MNVIRVMGGLGNQLYHYGFGQAMIARGMEVSYDITCYESYMLPYRLDRFNTCVNSLPFLNQEVYKQRNFPEIINIDNINFWGFWQACKYWEAGLPILKKEIWVKKELYTDMFSDLREEIINCQSVSVHVRRQDGLVFPLEYFIKAIGILKVLRSIDKIYVFTDDIPWCKEYFKDVVFVHLEDYLDFELMRLCKHNIIPASSFSYWAAVLNDNPNKIVIIGNRLKWTQPPTKWKNGIIAWKKEVMQEMHEQILKDWIIC